MKIILQVTTFLLLALFWGCKDIPKAQETKIEQTKPKSQSTPGTNVFLSELLRFVDTTPVTGAEASEILAFRKIDAKGIISSSTMNEGFLLYKKMKSGKEIDVFPIFEVKGGDTAILLLKGMGFGGAIWGKVLVDRKSLIIRKIEFEHKAESEGYGAAMTRSSFEDKFVGAKIDLEKNTFTLQSNMEKRIDDGVFIDGISGATMTSQATLEMVNLGLKKYKEYLQL